MRTRASGSTFIAVLISISAFAALIAVVVNVTRTQGANSQRTILRAQAINYGEAVLESLFDQWRNLMLTSTNATDRSNGRANADIAASLVPPTASQLPPPTGITLTSWTVTSVTPMFTPTTRTDGRPVPEQGSSWRLRVRLNYIGRVVVSFAGLGTNDSVTVERPFVRGGRNLFDNFLFATQPHTEFHPGAPMFVDGPIYVGGDLWTAQDQLHLLTKATFLGAHALDYRPNDPDHPNDPTIEVGGLGDNWNLDDPPQKGVEQKLFDTRNDELDPNFVDDVNSNDTDSDSNQNNNGFHELIEEPSGTGTDPLQLDLSTSERLSKNADYRIVVNAGNTVTIYRGTSTTALSTSSTEYTALRGAMTLNTAIRDVRENDYARLVSIDVGAITTAHNSAKISDNQGSDGLLIYVVDSSAGSSVSTSVKVGSGSTSVTSSKLRGVKLTNGGVLPSVGLTFATPNPVYIQGDYNSGKTSSAAPPSNGSTAYAAPTDKPQPVAATYNRAAAAIAADAVNVLSNAWVDGNSLTNLGTRIASNSTINAAIIAGNVPTTTSSYSGGIENFARFHEDWSDRNLTVYGSFASLFNSAQAKGEWNDADYSPPSRHWFYDPNLQDKNPPGFQVARVYERGPITVR